MAIHGRPYLGARIDFDHIGVIQPSYTYNARGSANPWDWSGVKTDLFPGYIPPTVTFCGHPNDLIPPIPGHVPVAPLRLYFVRTALGAFPIYSPGIWQPVDPADYVTTLIGCDVIPISGFTWTLYTFSFANIAPYLGTVGISNWLLFTEQDAAYNARKGIAPRVTGVTAV